MQNRHRILDTKVYYNRYCQIAFTSKYGSKTDVFSLGLILAELCIVMTSEERAKVWNRYFFILARISETFISKSGISPKLGNFIILTSLQIFDNYRHGKQSELIKDRKTVIFLKLFFW